MIGLHSGIDEIVYEVHEVAGDGSTILLQTGKEEGQKIVHNRPKRVRIGRYCKCLSRCETEGILCTFYHNP